MSDQDIDKGDRWFQNLSEELKDARFGIVCLTPSNLNSEWISFESGAIASKLDQPRVTALLIGLKKSNVTGPLSQFQLTEITESEFAQLMGSINNQLGENSLSEIRLNDQLEVFWPNVKKEIDQAVSEADQSLSNTEVERTERDLLEEILELSRQMARRTRDGKRRDQEEEESAIPDFALPQGTVDMIKRARRAVRKLTLDEMNTAYGSSAPKIGNTLYILRESDYPSAVIALMNGFDTAEELVAAVRDAGAVAGSVSKTTRELRL